MRLSPVLSISLETVSAVFFIFPQALNGNAVKEMVGGMSTKEEFRLTSVTFLL